MTIAEAFRNLTETLYSLYDKREAENIADMVIEKLTGLRRMERALQKESKLTPHQEKALAQYSSALLQHKPVQYVLEEAWFYGLPFFVNEHVLIPRPETEELVEWIISNNKDAIQASPAILDIGTGSGCIPVALKKHWPDANIAAIDISKEALNIAKKNADSHNAVVDLLLVDMLNEDEMGTLPAFDIIVSNPPYIPVRDMSDMRNNVLHYEPHTALFVPDEDPLLFYKAISKFAISHLNVNGRLYFEIHENLGEAVKAMLKKDGFSNVVIKRDMQGKERMVRGMMVNRQW